MQSFLDFSQLKQKHTIKIEASSATVVQHWKAKIRVWSSTSSMGYCEFKLGLLCHGNSHFIPK